jgi:hypothetical protein
MIGIKSYKTIRKSVTPGRKVPILWGLAVALILGLGACRSLSEFVNPAAENAGEPDEALLAYSVYLIGDGGDGQSPALRLLNTFLTEEDSNSAVVFLGDNIYPSGLPPVTDPTRDQAEAMIMAQLNAVSDFPGRIVFVPGNHDWGGHGLGGEPERVRRQENFVEGVLNRGDTFMPSDALPGPVEVQLTDKLVLVAIDTQWWLEPEKVYGNTGQYELELEGEFLLALDDVLRRHADKHVLVAAHHPIYTNGEHGGYFPTSEDIYLFLPFSRRFLGTPQDLSNQRYRILANGLETVFEQHDQLVYAAGHDHNLQYFPHGDQHYVVSGSGSQVGYVAHDHGEAFAASELGFSVVRYYRDGSAWLEFWAPEEEGLEGRLLYAARIHEPNENLALPEPEPMLAGGAGVQTGPANGAVASAGNNEGADSLSLEGEEDADTLRMSSVPRPQPLNQTVYEGELDVFEPQYEIEPYEFYYDSTVVITAGARYDVSAFHEVIFGEGYRDLWEAPVRVPVINLERTAGGLTPMQRGGGLQTISLRMQGADGDEYVLRSIDKDPSSTVPEYLRNTLAEDVVQDQISAINPYSAFVVPRLADAAGIMHTAPKLVVVPYSDRLGIYEEDFGGMLALFEARADEDQSDEARFGYSQDVKSTEAMFEDLQNDIDESVDIRAYIRARLFDMLIGDWDRHADQWRWAEFENEFDKVYKPIPRDRDFTFFRFGGLPARVAPHLGDPRMRRFSHFSANYGDVLGLNYNGAALDRRLTGPAEREVWLEIADSLRMQITDADIEEAVRVWPEPIFGMRGEQTIEILKARRDRLPDVADEYYNLLAHIVDLFGSDNGERFEIHRLNDEETEVIAYKADDDGTVIERELYRRTFNSEETGEIRIYGFGGDDLFLVTGETNRGMEVRLIGGDGEDTFIDESSVGGSQNNTYIYDTDFGTTYLVDESSHVKLSPDESINRYDPLRFEYNIFKPLTSFGYNENNGVMLGGGVRIVQPGFRKYPYAASHKITAEFGLRNKSYNLHYEGDFIDVWRGWNADALAEALAADRFRSFYGLGNETPLEERDLWESRIQWVYARPTLRKSLSPVDRLLPFSTVSIGPRIEYANVEAPEGISEDDHPRLSRDDLRDKYFVGLYSAFEVNGLDTLTLTESGARWVNEALLNVAVRGTDERYLQLASEFSYFYTFDFQPRTTLALRAGGAHNFGEFAFFQANTLGGEQNLRGYNTGRFSGRTSIYTNTEARIKLFDFNAYLTKGEVGTLGFVDTGRVWWNDEDSRAWHVGYGGGLWVIPFYRVAIVGTYGFSKEGRNFDLSLNFLF